MSLRVANFNWQLGLVGLLALMLVGCAPKNRQEDQRASSSSSEMTSSHMMSNAHHGSMMRSHQDVETRRAVNVVYQDINEVAHLDDEYREEPLYMRIPGTVKTNRRYEWDKLITSDQQRIYVVKKAIATYKDDDGDYDHEDYYRIRLSKHARQYYWVSDDALEMGMDDD